MTRRASSPIGTESPKVGKSRPYIFVMLVLIGLVIVLISLPKALFAQAPTFNLPQSTIGNATDGATGTNATGFNLGGATPAGPTGTQNGVRDPGNFNNAFSPPGQGLADSIVNKLITLSNDPRAPLYLDYQDVMYNFFYGEGFHVEDMSYKKLPLKGINRTPGVQPVTAMPHKATKNYSPLQLNEWYLTSVQNPDTPETEGISQWTQEIRAKATAGINTGKPAYHTSPYIGPVYRGISDEGPYNTRTFQPDNTGFINDKAIGVDQQPIDPKGGSADAKGSTAATCKAMIQPGMDLGGKDAVFSPEWMRLEMDNCANQYIMRQVDRYSNDLSDKQAPIHGITDIPAAACQPLQVVPIATNEREFAADTYYYTAWSKLLGRENYLARLGRAKTEPAYGTEGPVDQQHHIKISSPIATPNFFGHTETTDITADGLQVERIIDPSHPFSPRWDFEFNEREEYSPLTWPYGGNVVNGVRCAGSATKKIPVDVMEFRMQRFRAYIMARIEFNWACYWFTPCRTYVWEAYHCTSLAPCCATSYDQQSNQFFTYTDPDTGATVEILNTTSNRSDGKPSNDKIPTTWCDMATTLADKSLTAVDLCNWLAKPVVPVNELKMRENSNANFPNGSSGRLYF